MFVITGLLFAFSEAALLIWLLLKNKKYINDVVMTVPEGTENRGKLYCSQNFRIGLIVVCSLLAGASGFFVSRYTATLFESVRLGVMMLGVTAAALTDFYIYLIPNVFLLYTCGARLVIFLVELLSGRPDWKASILNSIIGGVAAFVVLMLFSIITRHGIGMGDVKLMSVIGFLGGVYTALNTLTYGLVLCVLCSAVLLLHKRKGLKDKIPFGPFICGGYILTLCFGAI